MSGSLNPATPLELRSKHAEFKQSSMDYLILNSVGESRPWKLQQDLDAIFKQFQAMNRNQRKGRPVLRMSQSEYHQQELLNQKLQDVLLTRPQSTSS